MRITREYFFDLCELVGKAITTARKKQAGPQWNMDEQLEIFFRKWEIDMDQVDLAIQEEAKAEDDHYGLFQGSGWQDSTEDGQKGPVDEPDKRKTYSKWGSEKFEQRKAQGYYDAFGDQVSCRLWELMRQVRFNETRVTDAVKDLQRLCNGLSGYISTGWGNRLAQIIDHYSW